MTHQILVPLDDSPQATAAVEHAISHYGDDDITLLRVIEYTEKKLSPKRGGRGRDEGWYAAKQDEATALFDDAREIADERGVELSTVIKDGDPSSEITTYADERDVDVIVMGIRKRSPTGKALFGSTAQDVLLSVDCPVVAVPKPDN